MINYIVLTPSGQRRRRRDYIVVVVIIIYARAIWTRRLAGGQKTPANRSGARKRKTEGDPASATTTQYSCHSYSVGFSFNTVADAVSSPVLANRGAPFESRSAPVHEQGWIIVHAYIGKHQLFVLVLLERSPRKTWCFSPTPCDLPAVISFRTISEITRKRLIYLLF